MDKESKSDFFSLLDSYVKQGKIPAKYFKTIRSFYESYQEAFFTEKKKKEIETFFITFLEKIKEQCQNPYPFKPFHQKIREPFDYYQFGLDFLRPLIDKENSSLLGKENLKEIEEHLKQNHNVIFLANHQIEADPHMIALALEDEFASLGDQLIFVAGERVITDPLAVPFSLGCNLLCIYSKRYINHPPSKKYEKQMHNKKTMQLMSSLLKEGGKCIYVAPSGGRDRRGNDGKIHIAPFDPQSIEMVYLMAKKAKKPTFFYPMTLSTYDILPPPETIQVEIGEKRLVKRGGIHLSIGPQIAMEYCPGSDNPDKHVRRKSRSEYIWGLVHQDYQRFQGEK